MTRPGNFNPFAGARYSKSTRSKMKNLPEISQEELLESIREGVKNAILTIIESGEDYSGMMGGGSSLIKDALDAIKEGRESIGPWRSI